jgi:transcriptional regulator with XRE-family HTH domain
MFSPGLCRAARGLLGWSQEQLARRAGVGIVTVYQLEAGVSQPRRATLDVIRRAFEAAGVEFTNGDQPGLRLTKGAATQLGGTNRESPAATASKEVGAKQAKRPKKRR